MDILKFLNSFFKKDNSKDVAKERLKLVLIHDRSDMSPQLLEMMKADIISVISKYADVEESDIDIKINSEKGKGGDSLSSALVANIPILKMKKDLKFTSESE